MSWIKKIVVSLTYLTFLFIFVAVLLEVIFRVLPTTSPIDLQPVSSEQDILRFEADQTAVFSLGANFYKTVTKKTNNVGFYSSFNYEKSKSPKIMIIGDSFVEAAAIENSDTIGEVLRAKDETEDIYQMGVSGVPLSQYIKMAEYAKNNYAPSRFVIVIAGNDFDQSLCDYRIKLGTWCFNEDFELAFIPFNGYEGIRYYARNSAFARYVVFQAGINWRQLMSNFGQKPQGMDASHSYSGNVKRFKEQEILDKSYMVVDRFFEELNNLQILSKSTLVLDADRQDIYNSRQTESYFQKMREYTIRGAEVNGVALIDMKPIFESDYKANGVKFEFSTDGHWNERAHKLVAEALMQN
jgi:hypothetical protein